MASLSRLKKTGKPFALLMLKDVITAQTGELASNRQIARSARYLTTLASWSYLQSSFSHSSSLSSAVAVATRTKMMMALQE